MTALLEILKANGVDVALGEIGLDLSQMFGKSMRLSYNPYQNHDWVVKIIPVFGHIVNAVPRIDVLYDLFWEEWFRKDGASHHHILYLKKPDHWDQIFEAPQHDDVHPALTLGKTWYVIDDADMNPILLR